jgi:hypothetical protein
MLIKLPKGLFLSLCKAAVILTDNETCTAYLYKMTGALLFLLYQNCLLLIKRELK